MGLTVDQRQGFGLEKQWLQEGLRDLSFARLGEGCQLLK